jgi:GNAT superfamily N-acetyltransferase
MLSIPSTETEPFRGWAEKLLVSPWYRKMGVGKILMKKLEEVARGKGKTLPASPKRSFLPKLL